LLHNLALPILADLHAAQAEAVHLGVLDRFDVLFIEKINGSPPFSTYGGSGTRLPAYSNALGKALLASSRPEVVDELIAEGLERLTPYTVIASSLLRDQIATIMRGSVSYDREEAQRGVAAVASSVVVRGRPVAGIAISGPLSRIRLEQHGVLVKRSAEALVRALG
jgi:DNA-binding IclR family transcriptional regulator